MLKHKTSNRFLPGRLKLKTCWLNRSIGRNHKGKVSAWHRGGGHKKVFRSIDFKRKFTEGIVVGLEHDPNRSASLARVFNPDTKINDYILASEGLKRGDIIRSNSIKKGNGYSQRLQHVITGSFVYNLSLKPEQNSKVLKSAGSYGKLIKKNKIFRKN